MEPSLQKRVLTNGLQPPGMAGERLKPRTITAARLRAMETRTGSVGDCSRMLNYRSNSRQNLFRRRSTRRRISNAQRLADLEDFINRSGMSTVEPIRPKFAGGNGIAGNSPMDKMRSAHAWAGRQINRAQQLIRELSIISPDPKEVSQQKTLCGAFSSPRLAEQFWGGATGAVYQIMPRRIEGKLKRAILRRVQASDNNFFERIVAPLDPDPRREDELYTIKNLSLICDKKQIESLYVEALYTIRHKVGKEDGDDSKENLYKYVRAAFQGDQAMHDACMVKSNTNKPPVVLLNIQLLEGRDLIAKDVNGFSDPFAMLGVVPGKRDLISIPENGPAVEEDGTKSPRQQLKKENVLQKFGGSFRRKVDKKEQKKGKNADTSTIPAKLIKASSVQRKTLNPKWNEKFQFIVDDVATDRFHIDIWDHDDEEHSVLDAVSSLNQISGGLKGLGRYFKEVAQSARSDSDESTDDFLGCITLSLNDLPADGIEKWFNLQPRSEKSKVEGSIKMKIWLSTKEERIGGEADELLDVKQHIELMRQFALFEIRQTGSPVRFWEGQFPEKAKTILKQHAVQGDLTAVHSAMCRWLAFHSMIPIDISFTLLANSLAKLTEKWQPMDLDKEEEDMLIDSFSSFDSYCKRMFIEHRTKFAPSKRNSGEEFSSLIKCMKLLRESPFYAKYLPYKRPFHAHMEALIVKSAEDFFDQVIEENQDEDPCKELLKVLGVINTACSKFLHFAAIIREVSRIDYSQLTLSTFDKMLNEYLASEMMSEKKTDLRTQMRNSANQDPPNEDDLVDLIRIHMAFVELRNYRLANRVRVKDESEWYGIFNRGIRKFLELIKEKAIARISLSCQMDVPISTSSNDMRHTSSHVDVCHIVEQVTVCWERMDVNETALKLDYTRNLVDILCEIVTTYTQRIITNLEGEGLVGELAQFIPSQLLQLVCSTINNCEQVRRSLMIHDKLHLDDLAHACEREGQGSGWRQTIEGKLEQCDNSICADIEKVVSQVTNRLHPLVTKNVFHLVWSPPSQPVDESLKPLTDMLDVELSSVHKNLLHKNFLRVMSAQLNLIVKLLFKSLDENPGMEPTFYRRLLEAWHVLVDFFHAGGKGLSLEVLESNPDHIRLVKILAMNQTTTVQLIEKYYKDLLKQQAQAELNLNEVNECKYGILNVRAYYNASAQTLVLDVIGAKQVIPLDTNGLSDPFVVIELVPKLRFPNAQVFKTKVVSKSLNPIFDETFEFQISPKLSPCAMIHFTVMDHDYLRSNDFAGEAFLELADVPGFGVAGGSTLRQFNLILIQPVSNSKDIMDVLKSRNEDKEAIEFLRTVSTTY